MSESIRERLARDTRLEWHLQYNHYPPISTAFVPAARLAIERAQANEWGAVLTLPTGETKTAAEVIEDLGLADFVETEGDE